MSFSSLSFISNLILSLFKPGSIFFKVFVFSSNLILSSLSLFLSAGTEEDPQVLSRQEAALAEAGVVTRPTNAAAAELAARLAGG